MSIWREGNGIPSNGQPRQFWSSENPRPPLLPTPPPSLMIIGSNFRPLPPPRRPAPRSRNSSAPDLNIPRLMAKTSTSSEFAQVFEEYLNEFPRASAGTISKTLTKSPAVELSKYLGTLDEEDLDVEVAVIKDEMAVLFIKHILKNQRRLDEVSLLVYSDHTDGMTTERYQEFDKPSPLKTKILDFILPCQISSFGSPQFKLRANETEIQLILAHDLNPSLYLSGIGQGQDDPWHPINLDFSFHHFQRTVNVFISFPPPGVDKMDDEVVHDDVRHMPTYKKRYICYMDEVATSNFQFLLAIISAFGTEASEYPSVLFDLMQRRNMLLPELAMTENEAAAASSTFSHSENSFSDQDDMNDLSKHLELLKIGSPGNLPPEEIVSLPEVELYTQKYQKKFPSYCISTIKKTILNSPAKELAKYYGVKVNPKTQSEILSVVQETLALDYLRHLINHQTKLDVLTKLLYFDHIDEKTDKSCEEFDRTTPLKVLVQQFLNANPVPVTNDCPKVQLGNGLTELQQILVPEFNTFDKDKSSENPYHWANDPWHPIHLSFSYHHFQRTVNTYIVNPPNKQKLQGRVVGDKYRHIPTYCKYYMIHMNDTALSNEEFVLAVISAYGTNASQYPSMVLSYLKKRNLLRDLSQKTEPTSLNNDNPSPNAAKAEEEEELENLQNAEDEEFETLQNSEVLQSMRDEMIAFNSRSKPAQRGLAKFTRDRDEMPRNLNAGDDPWAFLNTLMTPAQAKAKQNAKHEQSAKTEKSLLESEIQNNLNQEAEYDKGVEVTFDEDADAASTSRSLSPYEELLDLPPVYGTYEALFVPVDSSSPVPDVNEESKAEFLNILSDRIVKSSDDEDLLEISGEFCVMFRGKTVSEKINALKDSGLLDNLFQLVVTVLNVYEKFGKFLVFCFERETTLAWYITLAEKLHADFLPVWVDLLKEVGRCLRDRQGQEVMEDKFYATKHKDMVLGMLLESE